MQLWPGLTASRVRLYERAVADRALQSGVSVRGIWGFIDGTFRRTARPEVDESASYSGYKRAHGQQYQNS